VVLLAQARLRMAAADFVAAAAAYRDVLALPHAHAMPAVLEAARVGLLQSELLSGDAAPDYTRRVFDDPYHWAPFVLIGDWL
jgi:CHAT domain-containing protein